MFNISQTDNAVKIAQRVNLLKEPRFDMLSVNVSPHHKRLLQVFPLPIATLIETKHQHFNTVNITKHI